MNKPEPNPSTPPESVGKRIARLRSERGWTQQALASRLAMSRVAVSHIEMDLTIPSERSIVLLAGLFKLDPHELVEGTTYPQAKAERLPPTSSRYTELELTLALLKNDLSWLEMLRDGDEPSNHSGRVAQTWLERLGSYREDDLDEHERGLLSAARQELRRLLEPPA